jgi:hypothetical protein
MPNNARIRLERIPAGELSDDEIQRLMAFGRREAELLDEMEAAARAGDRNQVWRIAEELVRIQDAAKQ